MAKSLCINRRLNIFNYHLILKINKLKRQIRPFKKARAVEISFRQTPSAKIKENFCIWKQWEVWKGKDKKQKCKWQSKPLQEESGKVKKC